MRKRNITNSLLRFIFINLIFFFSFLFKAEAQQVSLVDQYYINPSVYNPAAAGYNNLFQAYILRNKKFGDFDGGQVFHSFTLNTGLKEGKYGIGLNLSNNNVGLFNTTQADIAYSYRIKINENQFLRLGLSAGISDFRLDLKNTNADLNDELLQANNYNNTEFVANIGAYYTNKNLTVALAIPQLINQSNISKYDGDDLYRQSRHVLLSGSYEIPISSIKDLSFVPNFMMRFVKNTPLQYDINAQVKLKSKGWFSVNYRNKYAIGLNIGVHALKNLKMGYSYNVNTQNSAHISASNHEFLIGYTFRKTSKSKQTQQSQELKHLKDLLEVKYNKISELEKELDKYEADSKFNDQDRDGVLDEDDKCPNTPPFYKVDENGCTLDSDKDGINDNEDMCPDTAGSIANNGCPDQTKKEKRNTKITLDKELENLFYEFGKSNLTTVSKQKADRIVSIMKENETYILKLHGCTDDTGSSAHNRILAYKRLVSIHDYLIKHNIHEKRIIIISHGEDAPLVENTNKKSRAFNRRVYLQMFSYE